MVPWLMAYEIHLTRIKNVEVKIEMMQLNFWMIESCYHFFMWTGVLKWHDVYWILSNQSSMTLGPIFAIWTMGAKIYLNFIIRSRLGVLHTRLRFEAKLTFEMRITNIFSVSLNSFNGIRCKLRVLWNFLFKSRGWRKGIETITILGFAFYDKCKHVSGKIFRCWFIDVAKSRKCRFLSSIHLMTNI